MSSDQLDLRDPRWNAEQHSLGDYEESDDAVTMEDYLDGDSEPPETTTPAPESPYPYDRDPNRHGTAQRCRWCGEEYPTSGRRNHFLNVHEANCEAKNDD